MAWNRKLAVSMGFLSSFQNSLLFLESMDPTWHVLGGIPKKFKSRSFTAPPKMLLIILKRQVSYKKSVHIEIFCIGH